MRKRFFYLILSIIFLIINLTISYFKNPYTLIFKSKTFNYVINILYIHFDDILYFTVENILSLLTFIFIIKFFKPNDDSIIYSNIKSLIKLIIGFALIYSVSYIFILSADNDKIANIITLIGGLITMVYTSIKFLTKITK